MQRRTASPRSPASPSSPRPSYFHHRKDNGTGIEFGGDDDVKKEHLKHRNPTFLSDNTKKAVVNYIAISLLFISGLLYFRPQGNDDRQRRPSLRSSIQQRLFTTGLPNDWQTWTFRRFVQEFQCQAYFDRETKPLYTMEYWQTMREKYIEQVDSTYEFDDPVHPTKGYSLRIKGNTPPYYADESPGRGRGLFASRNIHKGELVHDGTQSDITFPDAMSWRRFMFALPKEIACDVTEWSWTQQLEEHGPMKIMTSFTISILMNEGDTDEEVNVLPENSVSPLYYATREIQKGEEILTRYETYSTDFDAVGLGW